MGQTETPLGPFAGGRRLRDNILDLVRLVPLHSTGWFGDKSVKKASRARVFESSNPARSAYEFQAAARKGFVRCETISGKGMVMTMKDGSRVTYRWTSSSKDRSPVVELQVVSRIGRIRSQKIHFVERGGNVRG